MHEDTIIQKLQAHSQGFIGDDCALIDNYAITKDLLIEEVHFRTSYFSAEALAHKSLQVNLSDLAAMGARPKYLLCGISIPPNLQTYATQFLEYLTQKCSEEGVILIGGDTTASQNKLFISMTAIGEIQKKCVKYRTGAMPDDLICVAGELGWAKLGLQSLEENTPTDSRYLQSFLLPQAKVKEGLWLARQKSVSSMMDISDGLYLDLQRLCRASNKGSVIELEKLLPYETHELSCKTMLEGGEDYALLITIKKRAFSRLTSAFSQLFGYDLKVIGHITEAIDIQIKKPSTYADFDIVPFTHF